MRTRILLGILIATGAVPGLHAQQSLIAPKVVREGDVATLTFAVAESTDVEIAVLDGKGRVVRHLVAGVLGGKNPPPAPLQRGLTQKVPWDGKDDLGKPAQGGPFQFRLRAGASVHFGRLLGDSPYAGSVVSMPYRAPVNGLVTDAHGHLYVLMMSAVGSHGNSGMWPWHLRKFDRAGKYLQTLLPYAPSTKPEKASGFRLLDVPGQFAPSLYTSLYPVFAVLGNEIVPRLHDGRIAFVRSETRQLNFFALDGSNALQSTTMWPAAAKLKCPSWLDIQTAFSPDGRYAYYANVAGVPYDGKQPGDIDPDWPQGRIYRQDITREDAAPERFFDLTLPDWETSKHWMPSAWDKKTASAGIDVDAQGNVLVCDLVNHAVVEISPTGKQLSVTSIPWPDRVLVSRKTGDMYVISRKVSRGAVPPAMLTKITGRGHKAKVVTQLPLAGTIGGAYTLDETAPVSVLWLAGNVPLDKGASDGVAVSKLLRIEDRGGELVVSGDDYLNRDANAISFVGYMAVDREAELVYVTRSGTVVWRYHGETGKGETLPIKAVDVAIGPGGDIYTWGTGSYQGPIARFDRELRPKPLSSTGKHVFGYLYGRAGRGQSVCGMDVDSRGRVYATYGSNDCHVRVYDDTGELVEFPRRQKIGEAAKGDVPAAITGAVGYGGSIRVDAAGNIYLLQQGVSKDYPVPAGFEKDEGYRSSLGTIYKFPPSGGAIKSANHTVKEVVGAIASYAGCGPISRWNAVGACACTRPRFDIDAYGRLYIPNAGEFTVSIRDNADNEIVRFGGYGNFDCQGPASREPVPAIPLGWPVAVGATERFVYVGDALNHRVVRVDRKYAAEIFVQVAP